MPNSKYNMSFTTGGLFVKETEGIAKLYLDLNSWEHARQFIVGNNTLQLRTDSSSKRITREIIHRLKKLSSAEIEFLTNATLADQAYITWLAICRHYNFIAEFAQEVLREHYIGMKYDISHEDFDIFFNQKAEWDDDLDHLSPMTKKKLRQVLFRMMREADLMTDTGLIKAAMLGPELISLIANNNKYELLYFPAFEADLGGVL